LAGYTLLRLLWHPVCLGVVSFNSGKCEQIPRYIGPMRSNVQVNSAYSDVKVLQIRDSRLFQVIIAKCKSRQCDVSFHAL